MNWAKPFFQGEKSQFTPRTQFEGGPSSTTITKPNKTIPPIKKISWEEMLKRKEKGLCFSCNKRFTLGHWCAIKQLFVFDVEVGVDNDYRGTNQQWRLTRMQVTCLAQQIPNFDLKDKDCVPGGATDRRCYLYLYLNCRYVIKLLMTWIRLWLDRLNWNAISIH